MFYLHFDTEKSIFYLYFCVSHFSFAIMSTFFAKLRVNNYQIMFEQQLCVFLSHFPHFLFLVHF